MMAVAQDYVIDGNEFNKKLDPLNLEAPLPTGELHQMLMSQAFEAIEKKVTKPIIDEIDKTKPSMVKFVNLEALATGPHKEYLQPICASLAAMIQALKGKGVQVAGSIQQPFLLPWHLVAQLDKAFKGLPAPGQTEPP